MCTELSKDNGHLTENVLFNVSKRLCLEQVLCSPLVVIEEIDDNLLLTRFQG